MAKHWKESDMILAVNTLCMHLYLKVSKVAQIHKVPCTTLRAQYLGILSQQDSLANSQKLTLLEEEVIVQHILNLDLRLFPPQISNVKDIANHLL